MTVARLSIGAAIRRCSEFRVLCAVMEPPKVWSSVVRLQPREEALTTVKDEVLLWKIVSAGFAQRRKTILNNLRAAPPVLGEQLKKHGGASIVLCRAEVDLQRRAETLSLDEWCRIAQALE